MGLETTSALQVAWFKFISVTGMGVLMYTSDPRRNRIVLKIDVFFHFYFNFLHVFGTKDTHFS